MKAKTHLSQNKSRGGFTLVEMLVVIGMIATLAGISFPVYKSIQKKVEKQQLEMEYRALERAVDNFQTEYNHMPYIGANYPVGDGLYYNQTTELITVICGAGDTSNFKKINFFDTDTVVDQVAALNGGGGLVLTAATASYYLSYGNQPIAFRLDHNMDDRMVIEYGVGEIPTTKKIIFWDAGPDGQWYGYGGTVNDDMTNFDELRPK